MYLSVGLPFACRNGLSKDSVRALLNGREWKFVERAIGFTDFCVTRQKPKISEVIFKISLVR